MSRTKKVILNFITDVLPQVILAILGIVKIKCFLSHWQSDVVGLYQLYSQLFSYIALIEIGISSVILYRLYEPFLKKNNEQLSKIYNGANFSFNIIGTIIIILGLILSCFVSFFIKNNTFDFYFLQTTFILYVISNVFNYYTMAKRLIFYADEKNYIINLIQQLLTIVKGILEIVLVILGYKLLTIIVLAIIINLIINIIISIIYKIKYNKLIITKDKSFEFLKDLKSMGIHKISNLVSNNIDVILISKFIGLDSVIIYTTYQYIIISLQSFTDKISNSVLSSLGIVLKEDIKRGKYIFKQFNDILFVTAIIICVPLYFSINYFINIWYENSIYTSIILAILFSLLLFMNIVKQIFNLFVNALGLFKDIIKCSIIDVILNLTLSLILVNFIGIKGVLIATIISMLITEFIMKAKIVLTKLNEKYLLYLKELIPFIIMTCINIFIINIVFVNFKINNMIMWFIYSIIIFIVNLILIIIECKVFNKLNSFSIIIPQKIKRKLNIN